MPGRRFSEQISRSVGVVDDAAGRCVKLFSRRRRGDALLVPDEQRCAEFGFQMGDRRRDRGLRDEAAFRRGRQVTFPEHRGEISKLADIHSSILSMISNMNILPMEFQMASKAPDLSQGI